MTSPRKLGPPRNNERSTIAPRLPRAIGDRPGFELRDRGLTARDGDSPLDRTADAAVSGTSLGAGARNQIRRAIVWNALPKDTGSRHAQRPGLAGSSCRAGERLAGSSLDAPRAAHTSRDTTSETRAVLIQALNRPTAARSGRWSRCGTVRGRRATGSSGSAPACGPRDSSGAPKSSACCAAVATSTRSALARHRTSASARTYAGSASAVFASSASAVFAGGASAVFAGSASVVSAGSASVASASVATYRAASAGPTAAARPAGASGCAGSSEGRVAARPPFRRAVAPRATRRSAASADEKQEPERERFRDAASIDRAIRALGSTALHAVRLPRPKYRFVGHVARGTKS